MPEVPGMNKPPAFPLYAADFYMDTITWSVDEIGIYFRLLMCEWVNGPLPLDIPSLIKIASCGSKKFSSGWKKVESKFEKMNDGRLINLRLESVRKDQDNYRKSQQEAGKRGAEKRWKIDSNPNGDPIGEPNGNPNGESIALLSSLSFSSSNLEEKAVPPLEKQAPGPAPVLPDGGNVDKHNQVPSARKPDKMPKRQTSETPEQFQDRYMAWARETAARLLQRKREIWADAFPALDLNQEVAKAMVWLEARPKERRSEIEQFLTNWFKKGQNMGARRGFIAGIPTGETAAEKYAREHDLPK